ncbi:LytR/AlgR family response regulator transcription factor [Polaribacter sp. P097]|uniref:LytR/AlgR family response regulator transcription factor n=1 Tax=Polaribacter sp. P097 TaxID=3117398 RepID=UPI002FE15BCF
MKILIVDDEVFVHGIFEAICKNIDDVTIVNKFKDSRKALDFLEDNKVDLIFLDIQMPEFTGLDFLNELDKKGLQTSVAIVTSNPEYAIDVINNNNVVYFIKKPLHKYSIKYSIKEAIKGAIHRKSLLEASISMKKSKENKEEKSTHTFFSCNRRMINLSHDDIMVIKSLEGGANILTDKEPIISSYSLKEIETKLPASTFIRIHKSYIVNAKKIELIYDNLVIIGQYHVPIGRTHSAKFKEYLANN